MESDLTLVQAVKFFEDFENCKNFMVNLRWPDGVVKCPRCDSSRVVFMPNQRKWKCYGKHLSPTFTLKTGTVFEDSPIALDKWIVAVWQVVNCRNGISSHELGRALGVTQKSAWFMLHRIRLAMQDGDTGGKLGGPMGPEIEVDETYIGGKARNMHADKKLRVMNGRKGGGAGSNKTIVLGVLERKGHVRAKVISNTTNPEIREHVMKHVEFGSTINSDEAGVRWQMPQHFVHEMVDHQANQYVNGNVHTNGIENFWSLLKRGINGTYVAVEPFHLFRYLDEQAFRYNTRKLEDGTLVSDFQRFTFALARIVGKRLTYAELIGKEGAYQEAF